MSIPTLPKTAARGQGYRQTKIKFCEADPFRGLNYLAMWYSFCVEEELEKWKREAEDAVMGPAETKALLTVHPSGYTIRRIKTDGKLIKVYVGGILKQDSLLPLAVLGDNAVLLELDEVEDFFLQNGGYRARFRIDGNEHTGLILPSRAFWAAWTDAGYGLFFESDKGKNPNGRVLEKLPG